MTSGNDLLQLLDALTDGRGAEGFLEMDYYAVYESIEQLRYYYENWSPPPAGDQELRVHPATVGVRSLHRLPAAAIAVNDQQIEERTSGRDPWAKTLKTLRRVASGALLYADTVVEVDPLSLPVEDGFTHEPEEAQILRLGLSDAASLIKQVEPLIEAGVLILVPDPRTDHWIDEDTAAARALLRNLGADDDAVPGHTLAVAAALFDLRVAALADATILGIDEVTWRAISLASEPAEAEPNHHLSVATGLGFADLPFLAGIPAQTVLRVRDDEDAFVEWRANLRNAARMIRFSPAEERFSLEAAAVFEDYLRPQAAAIQQAVSRSASLKRAVRGEPIRAAFGAAVATGVTGALGMPISGVIIGALGGTVGGVASSALRPRVPDGQGRVFYELLR